jgi:hypothetical protein
VSWLFRTINVTQPIIRAEGTTRGPGHSVTGSRGVAWSGRGDEGRVVRSPRAEESKGR